MFHWRGGTGEMKGGEKWTTQLYVKGEPQNEKDFVIRNIKDAAQRDSVIREFAPVPGSKIGELAVTFDIVMGFTPSDS